LHEASDKTGNMSNLSQPLLLDASFREAAEKLIGLGC